MRRDQDPLANQARADDGARPPINTNPILNDIAAKAAAAAGTEIGLVTYIDESDYWIVSRFGGNEISSRREAAFCAWAVHNAEVFWVEDALLDARFHDNPYVLDDPHVRFYAGAPVKTPSGGRIGVVCVIDTKPRRHDPVLCAQLTALAEQASDHLRLANRAFQ